MKDERKTRKQLIDELSMLRRTIDDLGQSRARQTDTFRHMFEKHGIPMILIDPPTLGIIDANPAAQRFYGYSREEFITKTITDLNTLSGERLREIFRQKAGGDTYAFKHRLSDGAIRDVEVHAVPIRMPDGQEAIFSIVNDITMRKAAEKALRESEERYRTIIDEMEEGYQEVDLAGNFTFFNESFRKIFGYGSDELVGSNYSVYAADQEIAERIRRAYQQMYKTGRSLKRVEWDILRKDGERRTLEFFASALRDAEGRPTGFRGIVRDITDRKRAEEALRESRRRLADIIDFLPDATLVLDKDGKVAAWNRAMEAMTDVKAEEMLGKGDYEYAIPFYGERRPILIDLILHPDPERDKEYTAIRRTGDIIFGEAYTPNLPSGEVHLSATASVLRDSKGEVIAAIECIRNNTERKRLEAQLQQAQKMEATGTLAGGIAHDFNNLLMAIQGNASLMLMETDASDPRHEKLKAIEERVVMGADLTKQLLGFARAGRYEVKTLDMNEIVERSSAMFGRTKKEIVIHKQLDPDLRAVDADSSQMEQALINLYVNAWQAMPAGGHLYLETANLIVSATDERGSYMKPGRYVKISVTDSGVGMDGRTKERLFEPFFTTKEMGRGTGLGLAMVYGIVKGHNGYINVYSEKGKGTTFNIYLPASDWRLEKKGEAEEEILGGAGTILLVDDEETVIDVVREMLEMLGYQVIIADSGREALKVYGQGWENIDLVILDMVMPETGGGETFDRLKEINPDIKVLLSSGYSLNGEAAGIMARGCRGFIQKPAGIAELSLKVREVLAKQ